MNVQQSQSHKDIAETAETNKLSGETLVQLIDIEKSPFKYVKKGNAGFLAIGNYIVLECELDTAKRLVKEKDWDVIFNTMIIIIEEYSKLKNVK